MMSQSQNIAVYSVSDLKNTTDDALPLYLSRQKKFRQNHFATDVRLVLGYAAVAIAAFAFHLDYTSTWEKTKGWTLWLVLLYFALNGTLTLWIWLVEKGDVFTGTRDGLKISFSSQVHKYDPVYRLRVVQQSSSDPDSTSSRIINIESPLTTWFTSKGEFVVDRFHQWLDKKVPALHNNKAS